MTITIFHIEGAEMKITTLTAAFLVATAGAASASVEDLKSCYLVAFVDEAGVTFDEYSAILSEPSNPLYSAAIALGSSVSAAADQAYERRQSGMSVLMINVDAAMGLADKPRLLDSIKACNDFIL
jgi:hypothetical protein